MRIFSARTILIDKNSLIVQIGYEVFQKKFPLKDIISAQLVKNPFPYRLNFVQLPHDWLFNFFGGSFAVEITMRDGKKYRIATKATDELLRVLHQALAK